MMSAQFARFAAKSLNHLVLTPSSRTQRNTPSEKAQACAKALEETIAEPVDTANGLRQAATQLRSQEYSAVVIDQSLLEAEPDESETVLQHIETAIPVHINFAISGIERVVRELRAALHRRS